MFYICFVFFNQQNKILSRQNKITQYIKKFNTISLKYYFEKILHLNLTPSKIAFSIAIGIFIGLVLPMGLQTFIAIPIALMLGCNMLLTVTATLISNPITIVPIYYLAIKIGQFITHISISWQTIRQTIDNPSFDGILNLSKNGLIVLFTGTFVLALTASLIVYFITLKLIVTHRKRRNLPV